VAYRARRFDRLGLLAGAYRWLVLSAHDRFSLSLRQNTDAWLFSKLLIRSKSSEKVLIRFEALVCLPASPLRALVCWLASKTEREPAGNPMPLMNAQNTNLCSVSHPSASSLRNGFAGSRWARPDTSLSASGAFRDSPISFSALNCLGLSPHHRGSLSPFEQ